MSAPDRSKIGKANRSKGHRAERAVVTYLREQGWPDAMTTRRKLGHDGATAPGDIDWHPLVCLEVKDVAKSAWPTWCRQAVRAAGEGQVPCVVRRTRGVPDVAGWRVRVRGWEWLRILDQVPAPDDPMHDVDHRGETWPWVDVSMDELANAVAGIDRRDP